MGASISVVSEPRAVATGSYAQLSINTYFGSYCLIRSLPRLCENSICQVIRSVSIEWLGNQEQLPRERTLPSLVVRLTQVDQAAEVSIELIRAATPMMLITRFRL